MAEPKKNAGADEETPRLFDELGHVNEDLSAEEQVEALLDAGRTNEAVRLLAGEHFGKRRSHAAK